MNIVKLMVLLALIIQTPFLSAEDGKFGFSTDLTIEGFFSPKITEAIVNKVNVNSAAEAAGLISGQKILAINGCEIPGCSVKKAKTYMKVLPGETLVLLVQPVGSDKILVEIHAR